MIEWTIAGCSVLTVSQICSSQYSSGELTKYYAVNTFEVLLLSVSGPDKSLNMYNINAYNDSQGID